MIAISHGRVQEFFRSGPLGAEQESKSTYWFSPASLFLASSTSGRPGSASF